MQTTNTDSSHASQGSPDALDTIPSRPKTLCEMPEEVLMHIGLALPCREFGRFLQTNRQIHDCLDTHYVWHQRFTTRFGQPILQSRLRPAFQTSDHSSSPQSSAPPSPRFPTNTSQDNLSSNNSAASLGSAEGNSGDQRLSSYFSHHQQHNNHHNNQDPQHASSSHSGASSPYGFSRSSSPTPDVHGVDRVALPSGGGSSGSSSSDDEQDDEAAKRPAKAKGKGRKIDLRKTTKASKELLIELYRHYSRMTLPAEDMAICHMGDRYWIMIDSASSSYGKLAELRSVWWMDVVAVFYGVPPGRYKVQWRVKVTSDAPVVNSEFKAILFDKHEDHTAVSGRPDAILFKPRNVQEFTQHTDSQVMKADRKPFRNLFKGFTILELPGELVVEDDFQGVFLQIRNIEGWKSGLYVDYARLVDLDDPERSKDRLAASTRVESALDEEVNDEGEEYYPTSDGPAMSWLQNLHGISPLTFRSRGFRQYNPVDGSTPLDVGAGSSSEGRTIPPAGSAAVPAGMSSSSSSATTTAIPRSRANGDGEATELPDTWYRVFAILFVYCIYVYWTL
ncbi:hypothetical protein BGZ70_008640 [Mortierella alpina]|uniref:F-box domain-containing protein n=1 Tax=Mortierella alpina TaxID=64518 RepID=A0A9P6J341_MORAP|nr:hypothetical protein BGZ70_008640 [Mortierella alpina]